MYVYIYLWKESSNTDGQRFQQYQQNEESLLISNPWTKNKTTTYEVGNPGPGLGQAQQCGGVKPVNGIITLLLVVFCRKYLRTGFFFPIFWRLFICLFINVWFQKHFYRSLMGCLSILYFARLI